MATSTPGSASSFLTANELESRDGVGGMRPFRGPVSVFDASPFPSEPSRRPLTPRRPRAGRPQPFSSVRPVRPARRPEGPRSGHVRGPWGQWSAANLEQICACFFLRCGRLISLFCTLLIESCFLCMQNKNEFGHVCRSFCWGAGGRVGVTFPVGKHLQSVTGAGRTEGFPISGEAEADAVRGCREPSAHQHTVKIKLRRN